MLFAISLETGDSLFDAEDDEAVLKIASDIESAWDELNLAECDKSWDSIHRLLTDGELDYGNGEYPLNHCILGPRQLYSGEDWILSLVAPEEVSDVAAELVKITEDDFHARYETLVPEVVRIEKGPEELKYCWSWFQRIRQLYSKAAQSGLAILFSVPQ